MDSKPGAVGTVEIVGRSLVFQQVLNLIRVVANSDCVTLIQGETGTGKEVIARATHNQSSRRQEPFVALNCAATPGPCLRANSSARERGASRAPAREPRGGSNSRIGVRSFSTRETASLIIKKRRNKMV